MTTDDNQLARDEKLRRRVFQLTAGLVGALAVGALVIGGLVFELKSTEHRLAHTQVRLAHDEHATCTIQSRGLPASKHLANVMRDIAVFVEPPSPKNPLSKTLPSSPPVPEYYRAALANLRLELPEYNRLEGKQPSGRHC